MTQLPSEPTVLAWFDELSNWGRWGPDDRLGTLNHVDQDVRRAALALPRVGEVVSCAWDIDSTPRPDQPFGAPHRHFLSTGEGLTDPERVGGPAPRGGGVAEWIGMVYHGYSITHLDGLSHMHWDGRLYNDVPAAAVTPGRGATELAITDLPAGIVTRGVLVDVAAALGRDWLDPGEPVVPEHLEAALDAQGTEVRRGDAVLLRTGYGRRLRERGPDDMSSGGSSRAGWHAACLPWLHRREVAAIGADTAQDVVPSGYETMRNPVHLVGIVAMGLWLIDNCDLEPLAAACRRHRRWEFLLTVAPLRFSGATGSPVNPLATF